MKLLFLRGQVPTDRDPRQIMFNTLDECDDMWTQLAYNLSMEGYGEIWYWGGKRKVDYKGNFVERWIFSFKERRYDFNPDVIFCRGGFPEYDMVLRRNPDAFKIYYGAGFRRIPPKKQFQNYDLILVDTPQQLKAAKDKLPDKNIKIMIKPAAENIFTPSQIPDKVYDIILVGNYSRGINKGHDFVFQKIGTRMKILSVGNVPKNIRKKYPFVKFQGWIPRCRIPNQYAMSKVAVICCGTEDSCPRVIPEALACGVPIVVLNRVNIWKEKYINIQTGTSCSNDDFLHTVKMMVETYKDYTPLEYYMNNLSLNVSVENILNEIK